MVSHSSYWTLWMFVCFGQYLSQDLQIPELTEKEGKTAIFIPENLPPTWSQATWNYVEQQETLIITSAFGTVLINPAYEGRVKLDSDTLALELSNLKLSDSGRYRLSVGTGGLAAETTLQVFDIIRNVRIIHPEEPLIEGESSVSITCDGNGKVSFVVWMKDNNPLSFGNNITFSSDNRSVSISPVHRSDSGQYQCTYSNPFSSETGELSLTIKYGPDDVSIEGPDVVDLGDQVVLFCFANSEPSASFSWTFNGSDTDVTTSKYTINKADFTDIGEYICTAFNTVTNKRQSQTHALLVKVSGGGGGGGGLSAGSIAGIVIGVLVAFGGICGLSVYLTKNMKNSQPSLQSKGQTGGAAQRGQEHDLDYEEINDSQNTRQDGTILGSISGSQTYENIGITNEYENVKHGVLNRPRAPAPQVSNPPPVRR